MRRAVLLTTLCALLCAPAAASAKTRYWIRGAGFGHGVGMSQYGAYGMAQVGRNYQQILGHYYSGTIVSLTRPRRIRVLLQSGSSRVTFSGATRAGSKRLDPGLAYVARQRGARVLLRRGSDGRRVGSFSSPLRVRSSRGYVQLGGTALNGVTSGSYRGALELRADSGVTVVNRLGIESYLKGVVPGEMPSSWLPEALKAQAVAARTYAMMSDSGGSVFDVYPDTRSQMYKGLSGEVGSTNAAVRATRNQIVTYDGRPIVTYFFSTSGGKTESVQNVFTGSPAVPYLTGVDDPYDRISPRHRWRFGPYTRRQIGAKLGGLCQGRFRRLKVRERGFSPRIVRADVVCSRGTVSTTGSQLRSTLGTYDSWLRIVRVDVSGAQRARGGLAKLVSRALLPHAVVGRVRPAPSRHRRVLVLRRGRGHWRRVAKGRTGRGGKFTVKVPRSGAYRVRVIGLTGPTLHVR